MTVYDLLLSSLRTIGAVPSGEIPSAEDMMDAMQALNMMLANWSAQKLLLTGMTLESFTLTSGTGDYNIGSGQTFNTAKPIEIDSAFVRDSNGYDYGVDIISSDEYYKIPDINLSTATAIPEKLFYDTVNTQQSTSLGVIRLYPKPDTAYTLYIRSLKYLTEFVNLTDTVTLPAMYQRAVKYNLAIELSTEYGLSPTPIVAALAVESLSVIKNLNSEEMVATLDFGKKRTGNIYTFR